MEKKNERSASHNGGSEPSWMRPMRPDSLQTPPASAPVFHSLQQQKYADYTPNEPDPYQAKVTIFNRAPALAPANVAPIPAPEAPRRRSRVIERSIPSQGAFPMSAASAERAAMPPTSVPPAGMEHGGYPQGVFPAPATRTPRAALPTAPSAPASTKQSGYPPVAKSTQATHAPRVILPTEPAAPMNVKYGGYSQNTSLMPAASAAHTSRAALPQETIAPVSDACSGYTQVTFTTPVAPTAQSARAALPTEPVNPAKPEREGPMQSAFPTPAFPANAGQPSRLKKPAAMQASRPLSYAKGEYDEDFSEEDQEDAIPTSEMASPAPVRFSSPAPAKKPRRKWPFVLLALILLASVGAVLWYTGVLKNLLPSPSVPKPDQIPAVFAGARLPTVEDTLSPAALEGAPRLLDLTVEPSQAAVPATVTFRILSNQSASSIRLLTSEGVALPATVQSSSEGENVLWVYQVTFTEPYTGDVFAYMRDAQGAWAAGELSCHLSVE